MNVLYFGSDALSLRALTILRTASQLQTNIRSIKVVTPPDRVAGRGHNKITSCALKAGARQLGLEVIDAPAVAPRPDDSTWNKIIETTHADKFDVAVVFSFGYFMPKVLLEAFPLGAINIHPSLLPKYRGASPIQHALLNGDEETGVCVIEVHPEKFDSGNILARKVLPLDPTATYTPVSQQLADMGGNMVVEVLNDMEGHRKRAEKQVGPSSRAPKLGSKERVISDWTNAKGIFNKFRAFEVVNCHLRSAAPLTVTLFDVGPPQPLKIDVKAENGDALLSRDRSKLFIHCGEPGGNTWLPAGKLRLEGKSIVSPNEFYNGYLLRKVKTTEGVIKSAFS